MKKFICSVETPKCCTMIGIRGISFKHIKLKLKILETYGIYYDGAYSPIREVNTFPSYINHIY